MTNVKTIVREIERIEPDEVNIEWTRSSANVFPNKKPVELYLQITNDPEGYLSNMERKHGNELHKGFKWPADSLSMAVQLGIELTKYYGGSGELPQPIVDNDKEVFLAAHVIYRGCN